MSWFSCSPALPRSSITMIKALVAKMTLEWRLSLVTNRASWSIVLSCTWLRCVWGELQVCRALHVWSTLKGTLLLWVWRTLSVTLLLRLSIELRVCKALLFWSTLSITKLLWVWRELEVGRAMGPKASRQRSTVAGVGRREITWHKSSWLRWLEDLLSNRGERKTVKLSFSELLGPVYLEETNRRRRSTRYVKDEKVCGRKRTWIPRKGLRESPEFRSAK